MFVRSKANEGLPTRKGTRCSFVAAKAESVRLVQAAGEGRGRVLEGEAPGHCLGEAGDAILRRLARQRGGQARSPGVDSVDPRDPVAFVHQGQVLDAGERPRGYLADRVLNQRDVAGEQFAGVQGRVQRAQVGLGQRAVRPQRLPRRSQVAAVVRVRGDERGLGRLAHASRGEQVAE